jgi:hypothetical protein
VSIMQTASISSDPSAIGTSTFFAIIAPLIYDLRFVILDF